MDKQLADRKTSQPVGVKSAGCIFKNPSGESAGRLIDSLGLKGRGVGGARVSEVHANFFVHDGRATTADVLALIEEIKEKVYQATSIELEEGGPAVGVREASEAEYNPVRALLEEARPSSACLKKGGLGGAAMDGSSHRARDSRRNGVLDRRGGGASS